MDDNTVKEKISEAFIRLLMAKNRLVVLKPDYDYGVDLEVGLVKYFKRHDGKLITMNPDRRLGIQLKCTTETYVYKKGDDFRYDLRIKNYENLVHSKLQYPKYTEVILIVFILPNDEEKWLEVKSDNVKLSKHAFWYYPSDEDTLERTMGKDKDSTVRIDLKQINRLDIDFMKIYKLFYGDIS